MDTRTGSRERPLHIGIVACSSEGAALCYRTVSLYGSERAGLYRHPELSVHTYCLADYMAEIDGRGWTGVAELMLSSARKLQALGAELLICPDNTIHIAFPELVSRTPLPWLHIAEVVAEDARRRGLRRLGITGTRYTMDGPIYPEALAAAGIEHRVPDPEERREINRIIFEELVEGRFTPQALAFLQGVIARLRDQGCDGVVLGCTEIPILVPPEASPLPTLDSTRLLARAAVDHALGEGWVPTRPRSS
jgi:aspartate racemase